MLDVGIDIREDLARVIFVRHAIDYWDARMGGKAFDDRLLECADHHDVNHPGDHAGQVFDRLAARKLRVATIQVYGDPAQLIHPRLERHARARRSLLENHRKRSVAQRLIKLVPLEALLYPPCALEQPEKFVERKILELQEMLRTRRHRGRTRRMMAGTS